MKPFEVLYSISERDLEGVQIEPYFRRASVSLGVGVVNGAIDFLWPTDKALILNRACYNFNSEPATLWQSYQLLAGHTSFAIHNLDSQGGTAGIPFHGATATGVASAGTVSVAMDVILPAGSRMQFQVIRQGTTGVATCFVDLTGYLIPQGTIARGF